MIAFSCLMVGFLSGALTGVCARSLVYREQIERQGIIAVGSDLYKVTKLEAQSEK
ncbi:MAG: hypothetical protein RRZ38_00095 [Hafnia sp.]